MGSYSASKAEKLNIAWTHKMFHICCHPTIAHIKVLLMSASHWQALYKVLSTKVVPFLPLIIYTFPPYGQK